MIAAAAVAPPASHAAPLVAGTASKATTAAVASAASAAATGWMAVEELLAEAAYSLSQQIQTTSSPLDQLMSNSAASGAVLKATVKKASLASLAAAAPAAAPATAPIPVTASAAASSAAGAAATPVSAVALAPVAPLPPPPPPADAIIELPMQPLSGFAASVPGGDRLTEVLDDLLYSLSQDINMEAAGKAAAAAGDAVASAATAAAAGLVGAVSELPRAAAIMYRSASESAAAANAARVATVRPAVILPEPEPAPAPALPAPIEVAAKEMVAVAPPAPAPVPAPSPAPAPAVPLTSAVEKAAVMPLPEPVAPALPPPAIVEAAPKAAAAASTAADSLTSAAASAQAAASAAADSVAAVQTAPVVTAASAPSVADAATKTAASVIEAATSAAAGTVVIPPPVPVAPAPAPVPAPAVVAPVPPPVIAAAPVSPAPTAVSPPPAVSPPMPAPVPAEAISPVAPPPPGPAPPVVASPPPAVVAATPEPIVAAAAPAPVSPPVSAPLPVPESVIVPDTQLTAALQDLLSLSDGSQSSAAALVVAGDAVSAAASASAGGAEAAAAAAAATQLTEALRRELAAAVGPDVESADPAALADAAGSAITSALSSLDPAALTAVGSLPAEERLRTLLEASMQSSLDLVDAAVGGVENADSTLVGGVTVAAVVALLLRSLVSMASSAISRSRDVVAAGAGAVGNAPAAEAAAPGDARLRPAVGVSAFEAAATLNNDTNSLLLDIRNATDVSEQGLPDLRPFRRGAGATSVSLPYCDFRTTPTLANPSGALPSPPPAPTVAAPQPAGGLLGLLGFGTPGSAAAGSAQPVGAAASPDSGPLMAAPRGPVTVSVDPQFGAKFKQLAPLNRDSKVFLLDSYGVESPEAVSLLRSDPDVERMLGSEGLAFVEGGFAGPEGWKLSGLPTAEPALEGEGAASRGLDFGRLAGGMSGLRMRYPSLLTRVLGVGALGTGGLALASNLDWGAVARGSVGIAAALLVADRALPTSVRPTAKLRQHLQAQLAAGGNGTDAGQRRRTALLLRALDLAEAVGDAVVRAGSAAAATAGSLATNAANAAVYNGPYDNTATASPAAANAAAAAPAAASSAIAASAQELETQPSPANANTVVLPQGMDSQQWATSATASASRSKSPVVRNAMAAAAQAAAQPPPRSSSPLAARLGDALRSAADAVTRAASPARGAVAAAAQAVRSVSPRGRGSSADAAATASASASRSTSPRSASGQPDTLDLMAALAAASAMNGTSPAPGLPAISFPKASAGQMAQESAVDATPAPAVPEPVSPWSTELQAQDPLPSYMAGQADYSYASAMATEPLSAVDPYAREEQEWTSLAGAMAQAEAELAAELASARLVDEPPPAVAPAVSFKELEQPQEEVREALVSNVVRDNWRGAAEEAAEGSSTVEPDRWQWRFDAENGARGSGSEGAGNGGWRTSVDGGNGGGGGGLVAPRSGAGRNVGDSPIRGRERAIAEAEALAAGMPAPGRPRRQALRTASPERAAAAGAAMRRMRANWVDRDDDGLASGVYGVKAGLDAQPDEGFAAVETAASGDRGERSGSAGVAAARMARGRGGLSPGETRNRVTVTAGQAGRPGSRRQLLRTASPERAAAAAAAMKQLRAEMGISPNDGSDDGAGAVPVAPRDWRAELQGATGNSNGTVRQRAALASRSPGNWREQVEGSAAQASASVNGNGRPGTPARASSARLSASERAERDARLADWRARV
ncbi:hypothetical protein GPECTOR_55g267 [Gonium pectorale]|uniref:Rhodanese domain-containing protein n=1 Tax=Gonium pectorale TaxID=33097 RepID=A0A150G6A5_GONPE|nr:hypothetical protein GPECTOR_55g267 [Gonium pectorale]|eukprot:KXZ45361.1 hypothetical protein GPECTOR_55g267 [Gonium pectorale]